MEFYTLDDSLRRDTVIQGFASFIWTERHQAWGDFELKIISTAANKRLLAIGTLLGMSESKYVMKIETITEESDGNEGPVILDIVGRSMESLLDDRAAMPAIADLTTTPQWVLTDTPGNVMRTIFTTICVDVALNAADTIPFYHTGTLVGSGNITESADTITVNLQPNTVYAALNSLAVAYTLGFRLIKDGDTGNLYFEVYTGNDLTTGQTSLPAIVFSENLDNLANPRRLTSVAAVKTAAYVFATNGAAIIYAPFTDETASGLDRRVLVVDASDITLTAGADLDTAMEARGLQALAAVSPVYQFDGDISQYAMLKYGVDYNLGDICEEQNDSGFGNHVMVTEQIFVSDDTGEKSYPTFSTVIEVVPGTWSAWDGAEYWADVDSAITWGTL